jgi:arylsulfatase
MNLRRLPPLLQRTVFSAAIIFCLSLASLNLQADTNGAPAKISSEKTQKHPYNILFIVCDQEQHNLLSSPGYELPARQRLIQRGIKFSNHYISSAMCSPSRASFLTGLPPQRNGVFDQMEYPFQPTLSPSIPTMGSVLKKLGYATAYFGKFEMNKDVLAIKDNVNYSTALAPYGFDTFSASGDILSNPNYGYKNDCFTAGEAVRWLRESGRKSSDNGKPFFMVASLLNPHDIMFGDANLPGQTIQKGLASASLTTPPLNTIYQRQWDFNLPPSLTESLTAPGMPAALLEYKKGWCGGLGDIPTDAPAMWKLFYNYYLNMIRDNDTSLQTIIDTLDQEDLWKNTIVIFTADHGEMGGSHGGLRGKGPFAYEQNSKVPFIIDHPDFPAGTSDVLTSHLDILPTMIGLTGLPESQRKEAMAGLPGQDFSSSLSPEMRTKVHAVRDGVLFNYVGPGTIDAKFCADALGAVFLPGLKISLASLKPSLNKRGFLAFTTDGRYKFARYYAPDAFNSPTTIDEIFKYNDVQLFDLKKDPNEMNNLALDRERNKETILRMNALLNELMAKEVGKNDGSFLPEVIRPNGEVVFQKQ